MFYIPLIFVACISVAKVQDNDEKSYSQILKTERNALRKKKSA